MSYRGYEDDRSAWQQFYDNNLDVWDGFDSRLGWTKFCYMWRAIAWQML